MPQPTFQVQTPGLLTTVQDSGRPGWRTQGVPPGGALDTFAAPIANLLVGNAPGDALLEMTLTGPTLHILHDTVVAVCGADLSPSVDNIPIPMWHTAFLKCGQTLRFGARQNGARAYLAAGGGVAVPPVLGSRATLLTAGWGGFGGRVLRAGDVVETEAEWAALPHAGFGRGLRPEDIPRYPSHTVLRVVLGPQDDLLTDDARKLLLSARFAVTAQADRMGARLSGPTLALRDPNAGMLPSEGVTYGAVQVAGGQAVLLLADCGTSGGYPVAGVVISVDLPQAAQRAPGTTVSFQSVLVEQAHELERARLRLLRTLAGGIL